MNQNVPNEFVYNNTWVGETEMQNMTQKEGKQKRAEDENRIWKIKKGV